MVGLTLALLAGPAVADTDGPERVVLEDVPYIGPDWQRRLTGPEDLGFPSAMGSVMAYLGGDPARDYRFYLAVCGLAYRQLWHPTKWDCAFDRVWAIADDPLEPIRRAFEAGGYGYEIVGHKPACEAKGYPLDAFDAYVDEDEIRRRVCASIRSGHPVIAFGEGYGAAVIAGYEDHGDTVVGWLMPDGEAAAGEDALGYLRVADWAEKVAVVILVGEKRDEPDLRDSYRKALLWAVEAARTKEVKGYASGDAAFDAWAESLARDDDVRLDEIEVVQTRYLQHFLIALAIAEGRAFGGEVARRAAEAIPEAADDLRAAGDCYGLMHDLMWRIWQTGGGMGTGERQARRFAEPEVREHLREIVRLVQDQDRQAIAHLERALLAMGVSAEDIPPAAEPIDLAEKQIPGADRTVLQHHNVDLWVGGLPTLQWWQGKDCTFAGALEVALASTGYPCSYADIMGYSGLAFRTRWFHNPEGADTAWGAQRWHPVSPHGEQAEEIAAISRATGWQFRLAEIPKDPNAADWQRRVTDVVMSINAGLPVVVGCNTDLAVIYGYHIHSMSLFLRDYQRPDEEDLRVPSSDPKLHSPFIFLASLHDPQPRRDALLESLAIAARNGRRAEAGGFRFGLEALATWRADLAGYGGYGDEQRDLLFLVNWWCLMHLADARNAAVEFLGSHADLFTGESRAALLRAASLYQEEANALEGFADEYMGFISWWGGTQGVAEWDTEARERQMDLLGKAHDLEKQALEELAKALALESPR